MNRWTAKSSAYPFAEFHPAARAGQIHVVVSHISIRGGQLYANRPTNLHNSNSKIVAVRYGTAELCFKHFVRPLHFVAALFQFHISSGLNVVVPSFSFPLSALVCRSRQILADILAFLHKQRETVSTSSVY